MKIAATQACPECGGLLEVDHNSAQCHRCQRLWPKSAVQAFDQEVVEFEGALVPVLGVLPMDAETVKRVLAFNSQQP